MPVAVCFTCGEAANAVVCDACGDPQTQVVAALDSTPDERLLGRVEDALRAQSRRAVLRLTAQAGVLQMRLSRNPPLRADLELALARVTRRLDDLVG